MGGKGHRWEKEGPWKKDKYETPNQDLSEFIKKVRASAGHAGLENEGGESKWDSEKEHAKHQEEKQEANERDEDIRKKTSTYKEKNEDKLKKERASKEEERISRLNKAKEIMRGLRGDNKFYGHVLPTHFKTTSVITTTGRVR